MTITDDWFKDYKYIIDNEAEFTNPESKARTMWLHAWRIFSSSPFEQCIVFSKQSSGITSVTVSPSTATVSVGQKLTLSATVVTAGITNKAVVWSVDSDAVADGVTIDQTGELTIPSDASVETITVTATSVYDSTKSGTATVTVAENVTNN